MSEIDLEKVDEAIVMYNQEIENMVSVFQPLNDIIFSETSNEEEKAQAKKDKQANITLLISLQKTVKMLERIKNPPVPVETIETVEEEQ